MVRGRRQAVRGHLCHVGEQGRKPNCLLLFRPPARLRRALKDVQVGLWIILDGHPLEGDWRRAAAPAGEHNLPTGTQQCQPGPWTAAAAVVWWCYPASQQGAGGPVTAACVLLSGLEEGRKEGRCLFWVNCEFIWAQTEEGGTK